MTQIAMGVSARAIVAAVACGQPLGKSDRRCYDDAAYLIMTSSTAARHACRRHLARAVDLVITEAGHDQVTVGSLR